MEYIEAYKMEGWGGQYGDFGLKILISYKRELNDKDSSMLSKVAREIEEAISSESVRLDPAAAQRNAEDKAEILSLFEQPIFVEEIPNGYSNSWWYSHFPWYRITTPLGHWVVGWRKRVLVIDWSSTVIKAYAKDVIPDDVTKHDRLVHAWTMEKAKEYIALIIKAQEGSCQ